MQMLAKIGCVSLTLNQTYMCQRIKQELVLSIYFDGFVKSYIMPLRGTVTEKNLSIISRGYDLVI